MNDNMILAKTNLGPDWIDLGLGEPSVIIDACHKYCNVVGKNLAFLTQQDIDKLNYPMPQGLPELTSILEKRHGGRAIITNGAKQGISAVCYSLKNNGVNKMAVHTPYWLATPTLIEKELIDCIKIPGDSSPYGAFMLTSPGNPDGKELTKKEVEELDSEANFGGIKLIHDAAYYTPIYTRDPEEITSFGAAQIFSYSKMYGLSGLRLGYIVCRDNSLFPAMVEYVEMMCSGVSLASQLIALSVEKHFDSNPSLKKQFQLCARDAIKASREELNLLDHNAMTLVDSGSNSMFAWCKKGDKLDLLKAKVNAIDGRHFGCEGMVRLNIAQDSKLIREAVRRINESANSQG